MGELTWTLIVFGGGLVVGWVLLPEPTWFRNIWVKTGLADRD